MKINEFGKVQKVDEDFKSGLQTVGNALIGDRATSAIKGMFTGNAEQGAEDNFVKMFTTNITARLKNAISTGLVSPDVQAPPTNNTQKQDTTASQDPAKPQPKPKPQLGGPKQNPQLGGPKPKPQLGGPGDNPRLSEPPPIPPAGPQPKGPPSPADDYIDAEWSEVTPNKALPAPGAGIKMKESNRYEKLNSLFESILEADEPQEGPESISQFLTDWYTQYMKGYNWQPRKPMFDKLFKSVEDTYKQDGGKQALRKLAQASFAITGGGLPDKTKPTDPNATQSTTPIQPAAQPTAQPAAQPATPADATTVQKNLNALRKTDPKGYAAIVNKIISDYKKTFAGGTPSPAAPAAPATPPPTPPAAGPNPQVSGPTQNPQLPAPKK